MVSLYLSPFLPRRWPGARAACVQARSSAWRERKRAPVEGWDELDHGLAVHGVPLDDDAKDLADLQETHLVVVLVRLAANEAPQAGGWGMWRRRWQLRGDDLHSTQRKRRKPLPGLLLIMSPYLAFSALLVLNILFKRFLFKSQY